MTIIRFMPDEVRARLAELHSVLTPEVFREALIRGDIGRNSCSALDPSPLVGMTRWGRTHRGFREQVLPAGWTMKERPQSLTISSDARIAVAFATGTTATGNKDAVPTTKWLKGAATARSTRMNKNLNLFPDAATEVEERLQGEQYATWWLLFRWALYKADTGEPLPIEDPTDIIAVGDAELDQVANDADIADDEDEDDSSEATQKDHAAGPLRAIITSELSLPERYTLVETRTGKKRVRISKWSERIIMERVDVTELGVPAVDRKEAGGDDVDVEIVRRK